MLLSLPESYGTFTAKQTPYGPSGSMSAVKWLKKGKTGSSVQNKARHITLACTVYSLWRHRNEIIFEGKAPNPDGLGKMKKGIHPQMQWISYVTQSGRLMNVMMTKIHQVGKVYHFRAKRQMAESIGQIAKFKRRYGEKIEEPENK
ncbi:UNVERIFIED_CONTAM: hypothetical protein Scaly_1184600 [Sesamum calycinum]|uniref:Ribosomal protein L31 n=1 Tax=Sesamum calycinum TaxID=2727403 RepID=A0AAW2Q3H8_9LAMI